MADAGRSNGRWALMPRLQMLVMTGCACGWESDSEGGSKQALAGLWLSHEQRPASRSKTNLTPLKLVAWASILSWRNGCSSSIHQQAFKCWHGVSDLNPLEAPSAEDHTGM
eukprot:1140862-Pelagomonas_calceolata.AAC.4